MARYRSGLRTEAKILEATRDLLSEVGLEGTTLKLICDRAGIRPGSFYNLFESKEEAVLKVVAQAIAAVDPDPGGRQSDDLGELVEAYINFVTGSPELARIYLQIAVTGALADGPLHDRVVGQHRRRVDRFARALVACGAARETDGEAAAETLLAALNGLAFRAMLEPAFDFPAHARRASVTPGPIPADG